MCEQAPAPTAPRAIPPREPTEQGQAEPVTGGKDKLAQHGESSDAWSGRAGAQAALPEGGGFAPAATSRPNPGMAGPPMPKRTPPPTADDSRPELFLRFRTRLLTPGDPGRSGGEGGGRQRDPGPGASCCGYADRPAPIRWEVDQMGGEVARKRPPRAQSENEELFTLLAAVPPDRPATIQRQKAGRRWHYRLVWRDRKSDRRQRRRYIPMRLVDRVQAAVEAWRERCALDPSPWRWRMMKREFHESMREVVRLVLRGAGGGGG